MILKFKQHLEESKNPCWDGYKQVGTKKKAGKTVPNCVPVVEENDSAETMIGVVVRIFAYGSDLFVDSYYACVSPSIWDIAGAILEEFIDPDEIDEILEDLTDLYDIQDHIMNAFDRADEFEITIWTGLKPRSQDETYDILDRNPYDSVDALNSTYTNAKEIMQSKRGGSSEEDIFVNLVADSLRNDPSKLDRYAGSKYFPQIIKKLGWSDEHIKSITKYMDIKKQI